MIPGRDYPWLSYSNDHNEQRLAAGSTRMSHPLHRFAIDMPSANYHFDLLNKSPTCEPKWLKSPCLGFLMYSSDYLCITQYRHGDGSNIFPTLAALWFKSSRPPGTITQKISAWLDLAADNICTLEHLLAAWRMTQEQGSGTCLGWLGCMVPAFNFAPVVCVCASKFDICYLDLVNWGGRIPKLCGFQHHQSGWWKMTHPCLGWTMDCGCTCGHLADPFCRI
jgi:hypothetical protein